TSKGTAAVAPVEITVVRILPSAVYSSLSSESHCGKKGKASSVGETLAPLTIKLLLLFANCRYATLAPSGEYDGEFRREPAGATARSVSFPAASRATIRVPVEPVPRT